MAVATIIWSIGSAWNPLSTSSMPSIRISPVSGISRNPCRIRSFRSLLIGGSETSGWFLRRACLNSQKVIAGRVSSLPCA